MTRHRHDPDCHGYQWGRYHEQSFTCTTCDALDAETLVKTRRNWYLEGYRDGVNDAVLTVEQAQSFVADPAEIMTRLNALLSTKPHEPPSSQL